MIILSLATGLLSVSPSVMAARANEDESRIQQFLIGDYALDIPIGYLTPFQRAMTENYDGRFAVRQQISLHMQYPEILPPTPEMLTQSPKMPEPKYYFRVQITIRPNQIETHPASKMRKLEEQGACQAENFMDECPPTQEILLLRDKDAYLLEKPNDFIFCSKPKSTYRPHCEFRQIIIESLFFRVFFDRLLLSDVLTMRNRLVRRFCSWLDLPADRDLVVNRCRTPGN
ncbi:MAG: hypothetical protein ACPGOV_14225 [Magnetovibrionaceae bacterium]